MNGIFLDTSFVIALEDRSDLNHKGASDAWIKFKANPQKIITTTYVFDEIVTVLGNHINRKKAVTVGNLLLASNLVEMVHIEPAVFNKA